MIVEGQIHGGLGQGIGQALMEDVIYDHNGSGQLLTGTFTDYCLPRADDLPSFNQTFISTPATSNPLGVKGGSESGTIGAPAAIGNAVVDALWHLGVRRPAPDYLTKGLASVRKRKTGKTINDEKIRRRHPPRSHAPSNRTIQIASALIAAHLFIAGQVALDADGKLVGNGDIRKQATQVLENIRGLVEANGGTMADIAQVTVYVRDIAAFELISDIRESYFPSEGPASAIVEVSALAWPEFLIEISAIAALPS